MLRIEPVGLEQWRHITCHFADYTYRQCWQFGVACASRRGATSEHVAIWDCDTLLGLADVRVKRVLGSLGIAYINGGPLISLHSDSSRDVHRLTGCLATLRHEYVIRRQHVLRIRPVLRGDGWGACQHEVFAAHGFLPQARDTSCGTLIVDLARPLNAIRRSLDQKWRNGLNRAEKNGLEIKEGCSERLFVEFCRLFDDMKKRKGFEVELPPSFYMSVQRRLPDHEKFRVALVRYNGITVAGHVSSSLGDTCVYLLGAASEAGLQLKASYLLQWNAIETAQAGGYRWYDLGGIDPTHNPGVYHFKKGLSGCEVAAVGSFESSPHRFGRCLVATSEMAYRLLRSLRNRDRCITRRDTAGAPPT